MAGWNWENRGLPTDVLQIESITITPDPPKLGDTANVTIKATVQEEIKEGAYLDVVVKMGLIKLLTKRFDLFKELRGEGNLKLTLDPSCGDGPIKTGKVVFGFTQKLAAETPRGKFKLEVRGYTAEEDDLLSFDWTLNFTEFQS